LESVEGDTIATAGSACSGLAKAKIFEKKKGKIGGGVKKNIGFGWRVRCVYAQGI